MVYKCSVHYGVQGPKQDIRRAYLGISGHTIFRLADLGIGRPKLETIGRYRRSNYLP